MKNGFATKSPFFYSEKKEFSKILYSNRDKIKPKFSFNCYLADK